MLSLSLSLDSSRSSQAAQQGGWGALLHISEIQIDSNCLPNYLARVAADLQSLACSEPHIAALTSCSLEHRLGVFPLPLLRPCRDSFYKAHDRAGAPILPCCV